MLTGLFAEALAEAVEELTSAVESQLLGPILDWLNGSNTRHGGENALFAPGWRLAAAAFFAETVKRDPVLSRVVLGLQLDELGGRLDEVTACLGNLTNCLATIDSRLGELHAQIMSDAVQRAEVLQALAQGGTPESVVSRLRAEFPSGTRWTQTASQVRERLAQLLGMPLSFNASARRPAVFIGRDSDLDRLDRFVSDHQRGLVVVTAPPGYGKSALVAAWMKRRILAGDKVARHFISVRHDATRSAVEVLGHLLVQLNLVLGRTGVEPESADALQQNLHALTSTFAAESDRLIIVIDGLDEARHAIPPFVEHDLAEGVFVVVSCRAGPRELPHVLKAWQQRQDLFPFIRHDLERMSEADVTSWIDEVGIQFADPDERRALARRLWNASDEGVSLFLSLLIDDIVLERRKGIEAGGLHSAPIGAPPSFAAYVKDQFDRLQDGSPAEVREVWSDAHQWLMAVLSVALGPLTDSDLRQILLRLRREGEHIETTSAAVLLRDHRLARWLFVDERPEADEVRGHSRHAIRFSLAHGSLAPLLSCYMRDLSMRANQTIVAWANDAWSRPAEPSAIAYAFDWLPRQWLTCDAAAAVRLMGDPSFLLARLADVKRAADRLAMAGDEWALPEIDLIQGPAEKAWTSFWAYNEPLLRKITPEVLLSTRSLTDIVRDCLADSGIHDTQGHPLPPLAVVAHQLSTSGLIRSVSTAKTGLIRRLLRVGPYVVTFSEKGAVQWWTGRGQLLRDRGSVHAHAKEANGILHLGEFVVSWGEDFAIRWWSSIGEPMPDFGGTAAHTNRIGGLISMGSNVISWDRGGVIRWWTRNGHPLPDLGGSQAHKGFIDGVLQINDVLVSWGRDGYVRWWDVEGKPLSAEAQITSQPYFGELFGSERQWRWRWRFDEFRWEVPPRARPLSIIVATACASHGRAGADPTKEDEQADRDTSKQILKGWELSGSLRPDHRFDPAHDGWVFGVLRVDDVLVSRSPGEVQSWTLAGQRLTFRTDSALFHVDGWLAIERGFVTWDDKGSIRWWNLHGRLMADHGASLAHAGRVRGVLRLAEFLVSWGADGAIRWWTLDGRPLADCSGGSAHRGSVLGVLPIGPRLVSYGEDGAIRQWTHSGQPLGNEEGLHAHDGPVFHVLPLDGNEVVSSGLDQVLRWSILDDTPVAKVGGAASADSIAGVLPIGQRIISWGRNGALYWWSEAGYPIPDAGDSKAHNGRILGVISAGGCVVSWGEDGAVRWWSPEGRRLSPGGCQAHSSEVHGVRRLDNGLFVSWGKDGSILWWTSEGELMPDRGMSGGELQSGRGAHQAICGPVDDVVPIREWLVSYGRDGLVRWWTPEGSAQHVQAGSQSHGSGVCEILDIGDSVLSAGWDGTICRWVPPGHSALRWDVRQAHGRGGFSMKCLGRHIVTWGRNGALRWWTRDGAALPNRGSLSAHQGDIGNVLSVGDALVSFGNDGAMRWWTLDGQALPGRGSEQAHPGGVRDVLRIDSGLISWGADGAIHWWTNHGDMLRGRGYVWTDGIAIRKLLKIGNCLAGLDSNGLIFGMSTDGTYNGAIAVPGGARNIWANDESGTLVAKGKSLWIYSLHDKWPQRP